MLETGNCETETAQKLHPKSNHLAGPQRHSFRGCSQSAASWINQGGFFRTVGVASVRLLSLHPMGLGPLTDMNVNNLNGATSLASLSSTAGMGKQNEWVGEVIETESQELANPLLLQLCLPLLGSDPRVVFSADFFLSFGVAFGSKKWKLRLAQSWSAWGMPPAMPPASFWCDWQF